jgi:hypothetical protein
MVGDFDGEFSLRVIWLITLCIKKSFVKKFLRLHQVNHYCRCGVPAMKKNVTLVRALTSLDERNLNMKEIATVGCPKVWYIPKCTDIGNSLAERNIERVYFVKLIYIDKLTAYNKIKGMYTPQRTDVNDVCA